MKCGRCGGPLVAGAVQCPACGVRVIWPGTAPAKKKANPVWGLIILAGLGVWIWGAVAPKSGPVTVTYKLTGSGPRTSSADLTYTDGSGNIQQQTGRVVPLTTSGKEGMSFT